MIRRGARSDFVNVTYSVRFDSCFAFCAVSLFVRFWFTKRLENDRAAISAWPMFVSLSPWVNALFWRHRCFDCLTYVLGFLSFATFFAKTITAIRFLFHAEPHTHGVISFFGHQQVSRVLLKLTFNLFRSNSGTVTRARSGQYQSSLSTMRILIDFKFFFLNSNANSKIPITVQGDQFNSQILHATAVFCDKYVMRCA